MRKIPSKLKKFVYKKRFPLIEYKPIKKTIPEKTIQITTAWKGLELIIEDILEQFNIDRGSCIEFGVEFGFSAVVFSNYFKKVTGVDIFIGDEHTSLREIIMTKQKSLYLNLKTLNCLDLIIKIG